jgi:Type II secretion system (T2SS), protein E, N-terminal domain
MPPRESSGAPAEPRGEDEQGQPVQLHKAEPLERSAAPSLPLLTVAGATKPASPAATATAPGRVVNLGVPLGTLIFRAGLLTEEQLEAALQEGVRSGKRLGEVLLESGLLDQSDLGRLLADQKGLRFVELSSLTLEPRAIALLTAEKAHMFGALPVGFEDGVPVVAVSDPSNELVTENLRRALGAEPRLVVASRSDLHATIDRLYGAVDEGPAAQSQPRLNVAAKATRPVSARETEIATELSYDVSLRLTDGERVHVGSFGDAEQARESARGVVEQLSGDGGDWPFFSGRFLRPDTIVSVDIDSGGRPTAWAGSSHRAAWASGSAS